MGKVFLLRQPGIARVDMRIDEAGKDEQAVRVA